MDTKEAIKRTKEVLNDNKIKQKKSEIAEAIKDLLILGIYKKIDGIPTLTMKQFIEEVNNGTR